MPFALHPEEARLLSSRRALVTGGSTGIGAGCCYELAAHGAAVAVNHIGDRGPAEEICAAIEQAGGRAVPVEMDVADEASVQRGFAEASDALGGLDVLVNCAGVMPLSPAIDMPEDTWDETLAVNLKAPFLASQAAARIMAAAGHGRIVNVTSTRQQQAAVGAAAYCASKAGLLMLTRVLALELAPLGIRVNALNPVAGETPLLKTFMGEDTPEMRAKFLSTIPIGRFSTPADIGNAACFLCSDEASMITGVALEVDGGRTI
jgi:3-oxoacyl-[acyl-carrier protein] reductase